ncbi:MAG: HAD-IA family hydrolase [bacterium]|nr:HAD-IA family hydrolase [bacterium]
MTPPLFLLDLGNVLLKLDFERFVSRAAERGVRSREEIRERYIVGESNKRFERGQRSAPEFIEELREFLGWSATTANRERLRLIWCDIFDEFPGARAALAQLKQWGTVWVLSDTDPLHIEWVRREFSWALEVEQVLTSYERGKMKSDPGVFETIVAESGIAPERILFIDDLAKNREAAHKARITTHLFTTWEQAWEEIA